MNQEIQVYLKKKRSTRFKEGLQDYLKVNKKKIR